MSKLTEKQKQAADKAFDKLEAYLLGYNDSREDMDCTNCQNFKYNGEWEYHCFETGIMDPKNKIGGCKKFTGRD